MAHATIHGIEEINVVAMIVCVCMSHNIDLFQINKKSTNEDLSLLHSDLTATINTNIIVINKIFSFTILFT